MSNCCRVVSPKQQVEVETVRVKVLKVIGETVGQVVVEGSIAINAIKIDRIHAELRNVVDHVFKNKIVKQGIIHKQIFFVTPDNDVKHASEDIPFMLTVDIPGVDPDNPFLEVQNHLLDIDTDFVLEPATGTHLGRLSQKVAAHILVKVSEWTQLDVVTKVDVFPKVNSLSRIDCCHS